MMQTLQALPPHVLATHTHAPASRQSGEAFGTFSRAQHHVDCAAMLLGLDAGVHELVRAPQRELSVRLPVVRDDRQVTVFTGYRVQHSLARGPALGGLQYQAGLGLNDVRAAAMRATWQCALANLPFGGAAGGVNVDTTQLSHGEIERLTRRYTTEVGAWLGANRDVLTLDLGTTPEIMAWVMDTLSMHHGYTIPSAATGKPAHVGGSHGRQAVARGLVTVLEAVCAANDMPLHGQRILLLGGASPENTDLAPLFSEWGATVDTEVTLHAIRKPGTHATQHYNTIILGALAPTLDAQQVEHLAPRLVVEYGSMLDLVTDSILGARGVTVVPDTLAGLGRVIASYFEWVQGMQQFFWSEQEVHAQLVRAATQAAQRVLAAAEEQHISLRHAALVVAIERVAQAITTRGIYP